MLRSTRSWQIFYHSNLRTSHQPILRRRYYYSTSSESSPELLPRLRDELKTAMRSKDAVRKDVLRAVLAEITNKDKTPSPVRSDLDLLSIFKKQMATVKQSIQEFYEADRKDLVAKEEQQLHILEQYAGSIKVLTQHQVTSIVEAQIDKLQASGKVVTMPEAMKSCMGPGGAFEGQPVEKSLVASTVKTILEAKNSSQRGIRDIII